MSTDDKASLDERLRRLGIAPEVHRMMAVGIGKLPVRESTKTSLTSASATAVVVVGETGVALAKGAVEAGKGAATAAKDGAEVFQRTLHEHVATSAGQQPSDGSAESETADVTTRLERLGRLHADGHLDDDEYRAAKARVLAGE